MKKLVLLLSLNILLSVGVAFGNGITLSNLTSVGGSGFVQLQFDITWSNSWNTTINHDAAWVFFKWKDNDGTWRHLKLTGSNNTISPGYTLDVPGDMTGAMIYRSAAGTGTTTLTGVRIGVMNLPGNFDVKGFALEMVQIPMDDQYLLGDGQLGDQYRRFGTPTQPFLVKSNSITLGVTLTELNDPISGAAVILLNFPIAYNTDATKKLYMMKHEVSQAAYRDFLNTLSYTQQQNRTGTSPGNASKTQALLNSVLARRGGIQIATPGINPGTPAVYGCNINNNNVFNEASDGEWIGCNYLEYQDLAAFLDWAAIRPMTEMEYEKSCRGTLPAVLEENAAGTANAYAGSSWIYQSLSTANEKVLNYTGSVLNANITYNAVSPGSNAPTRVGIHATATSTRISAGAGYYGALDLSGNIQEFAVTTANAAGRSFNGASGDGELNAAGCANEDFWPGINGNNNSATPNVVANAGIATGVTGQAGVITRGGSAGYIALLNQVSYRSSPGATTSYPRNGISGGRGVKSW